MPTETRPLRRNWWPNPDVTPPISTSATAAMQRETNTIPVVFVTVPIRSQRLCDQPQQPGSNITGFVCRVLIAGKWVELLKEIAPAPSAPD